MPDYCWNFTKYPQKCNHRLIWCLLITSKNVEFLTQIFSSFKAKWIFRFYKSQQIAVFYACFLFYSENISMEIGFELKLLNSDSSSTITLKPIFQNTCLRDLIKNIRIYRCLFEVQTVKCLLRKMYRSNFYRISNFKSILNGFFKNVIVIRQKKVSITVKRVRYFSFRMPEDGSV